MSLPAPISPEIDPADPGAADLTVLRYSAKCKACGCAFSWGIGNGTYTAEALATGFTVPCPNCTLAVFKHLDPERPS